MTTAIDSVNIGLGHALAHVLRPQGVENLEGDGSISVGVTIEPVDGQTPEPSGSPVPSGAPVVPDPPTEDLAQSGGDPALLVAALIIGGALIVIGAAVVIVRRARRGRGGVES